jgi:hypothetical protein
LAEGHAEGKANHYGETKYKPADQVPCSFSDSSLLLRIILRRGKLAHFDILSDRCGLLARKTPESGKIY